MYTKHVCWKPSLGSDSKFACPLNAAPYIKGMEEEV